MGINTRQDFPEMSQTTALLSYYDITRMAVHTL